MPLPRPFSHAMTATSSKPAELVRVRIRRIRRRTPSPLLSLSVLSISHFREEARRLIRTTLMTTIDGDADIQDTRLALWIGLFLKFSSKIGCAILDNEGTVPILVSCLLHKCEEGDPVSLSSDPSSHPPPLRRF